MENYSDEQKINVGFARQTKGKKRFYNDVNKVVGFDNRVV